MKPATILALGYGAFLLYAFPGFMSADSFMQLAEARSQAYTDWHPPMMAAMWHLTEHLAKGPAPMLVLQSASFLVGAYRLFCRHFAPRAAAVATIATLLFPPMIAPMAVIWKDSQMAGYLLLGFSLAIEERRSLKLAGLLVLVLASAMRANAPAAAVMLIAIAFEWRANLRPIIRLALAVAIGLVVAAAAIESNHALTKNPTYPWQTSTAEGDIAGVLRFSRQYSDAELRIVLDGAPIAAHDGLQRNARKYYSPVSWWRVSRGDVPLLQWPGNVYQATAIADAWQTLVRENPRAYLRHRWRVFREVVGFNRHPLFDPVWHERKFAGYDGFIDDETNTTLQSFVGHVLDWIAAHAFFFRPYGYFLMGLCLVPLAWRQRDLLALVASGLVYELTLLPFAPSPDLRYSHWMMTTTLIAAICVFAQRWRQGRAAVRA